MTSVIWLHTVIKQCFTYVLENKNPSIKYTSIIVSNVWTQRHAEYTSKFMVGFPKIKILMVGQSGWARVQRKSFLFTACHSGKLKLAFTSPDVISTSCKNFLTSRTDFTVIPRYLNSSKKHQLPIAHWASEKQNSLAQQQNPLAPGYCTLLSLHAGGPYLIEHFSSLKDKKRTGEWGLLKWSSLVTVLA